jgi:hypothetical protein
VSSLVSHYVESALVISQIRLNGLCKWNPSAKGKGKIFR